jgi:hypothetical protein
MKCCAYAPLKIRSGEKADASSTLDLGRRAVVLRKRDNPRRRLESLREL